MLQIFIFACEQQIYVPYLCTSRLLLFQEKEQLLRELRSITPRTRSQQEMQDIQQEIRRLEQDLNNALEMSNRAITDR
jgi:protein KIBRA